MTAPKPLIAKISQHLQLPFFPSPSLLSLLILTTTSSPILLHYSYLKISETTNIMQPKSFICRVALKGGTFRPEIRPQLNPTSQSTNASETRIASRMSVTAICGNQNPLVSLEAIASQMRLERVHEDTTREGFQVIPPPGTTWEQPESPSLSELSSSLSEAPTTPTICGRVSPDEEDGTPRSLKRKRQFPKIPTTPTSSARTTPAHSPSTVATSPGSPDVARKIRSLRYVTMRPCKLTKRSI